MVIGRLLLALCMLSIPAGWAVSGGADPPPDIARILNRGELVVALHKEDVAPFFMRDDNGRLDGLDAELARDIAANLGVEVRFVRHAATYDGLVDLVARGEADVAISLLSRTLKRALRVSFTHPYAELHQALLINRLRTARLRPQNDLAAALDGPGIRIGTIAGSAYMGFAAEGFPQAQVVSFSSWQQAVDDLLAGNIHAVLYDEIEVLAWQQQNRSLSLYVKTVVLRRRKDHIAMAVNWRDTHWLDWLNLYLETISETGALERLMGRYQKGGGMAVAALSGIGRFLTSAWTVVAGLLIGAGIGLSNPELAAVLAPYGEIYLGLLKMCVLPLMMAALVSSLGRLLYDGSAQKYLGRMTLVFGVGLLLASLVGVTLATWIGPGRHIDDDTRLLLAEEVLRVEQDEPGEAALGSSQGVGLLPFLRAMIPDNVFSAASSGSVLSVVFFCVVAGLALGSLRNEQASAALQVANAAYETMLTVIGWLMYGLPLGLACLVADQISRTGGTVLAALAGLVFTLYLAVLVMVLIYTAITWLRSDGGPLAALGAVRKPLVVALGTSSSFAAIPAALRSVHENLGRERQGGDLVVPLGITLNPQGNVLHFSIAALFVAQLYGQTLTLEHLGIVVVASVLTSVAASGAPGVAALGMLTLVLEPLGLPAAVGLILLTAIDPIVDPLLTAANVHATCASTTLIAEREAPSTTAESVSKPASSADEASPHFVPGGPGE